MADTKTTALTEDTTVLSTDLGYTVEDPGGTPTSKKATWLNILKGQLLGLLTSDGDLVTRTSGAAARLTRASLAADSAFSGTYAPLPHRVYIDALEKPLSGQFTVFTLTLDHIIIESAAAAQNDEARYVVDLAAGTWDLAFLHYMRNVRPIYTFALSTDNSSFTDIGTIDGYSSVASGAGTITRSTITGITVATSGRYYLRVQAATRNASATGWAAVWAGIGLTRTGA